MMNRVLIAAMLLLSAGVIVHSSLADVDLKDTAGGSPDVKAIIRQIDQLYRSKSSYADIEMKVVTPHWQRTLAMKGWTEGTDKTFIRITSPPKEAGVATLRIKSEMWNYLPKVSKVIKIPPSMMMSSWMGSDFTNDDLVKEFSLIDDYSYEIIHPDSADPALIYVKCTPHPDVPVVWGYIIIAATKSPILPVWENYFDEQGNLMRRLTFSDIRTFGDRTIPATMEMVPVNKEGHRTVITYKGLEFDLHLDENIFSLRNLQTNE
jgi:hypothetical protein